MGEKVCSNGPGHMIMMAAMALYNKNLKNLLLRNQKVYDLETWYAASDGGTKVCSNGPGHMTKMAAIAIYDKNLKIAFSGTKKHMTLKLGMQHRVHEYYQVCSNDDPGLTLTYVTAKSNLLPYAFVWETDKTMGFQKLL